MPNDSEMTKKGDLVDSNICSIFLLGPSPNIHLLHFSFSNSILSEAVVISQQDPSSSVGGPVPRKTQMTRVVRVFGDARSLQCRCLPDLVRRGIFVQNYLLSYRRKYDRPPGILPT